MCVANDTVLQGMYKLFWLQQIEIHNGIKVGGEAFPVEYIIISCVSSYLSESGNCSKLNMKLDGTYYNQV